MDAGIPDPNLLAPVEPAPAKDWRDPGIATDKSKFIESYYALRDEGLSREQAEEAMARYVVGISHPGTTDKDYDDAFKGVSATDVLMDYVGLRDPGFFSALAEGVGRGAVSGGLSSTGFAAGMRAGAKIGAAIPFPGAKAAMTIGGGAAGLVGGALAGTAVENAVFPETGVVPEALPYMEAGKTVGGGAAGLPATTVMIRQIPPSVSQLFQNVKGLNAVVRGVGMTGQMARQAPISFTVSQAPGAVGAGVGAFGAEMFDPGDVFTRIASETLSTLFYPPRLLGGAAAATAAETPGGLFSMPLRFLESSQQKAAAGTIIRALREFQEDPEAILKILSGAMPLPDPSNPGRSINLPIELDAQFSPALAALSNAASQRSPGLAGRRDEAFRNAEVAYSTMLKLLAESGDPAAIQRASEIRKQYAEALVGQIIEGPLLRLQSMEQAATSRLSPNRQPGDAARLFGERVYASVKDSLTAWRNAERGAYDKADLSNVFATADNIIDAWQRLKTERLIPETEKEVDSVVRNFVNRVSGQEPNLENDRLLNQALSRTDAQARSIRATFDKNPEGRSPVDDSYIPSLRSQMNFLLDGEDPPSAEDLRKASPDQLAAFQEMFKEKLGALLATKKPARGESVLDPPQDFLPSKGAATQVLRQYIDLVNTELDVRKYTEAMRTFSADTPQVSLREVHKFRSEMLSRAREAAANNAFGKASIYSHMAEAALDDLGVSEKAIDALQSSGGRLSPEQEALRDALAISRAGNDLFSRTFAGDVLDKEASGALRVIPELLSDKFIKASDNVAAQRMIQLETALANAPGAEAADRAARVGTVNSALDYLFRDRAAKYAVPTDVVLNPATGQTRTMLQFDGPGLERFLRDNAEMLNLPALRSLRNDLQNVETANGVLLAAQSRAGKLARDVETDAWFSKYLGGDSPLTAFATAMSDKTKPETSFRQLLHVLRNVPTEQLPGPTGSNLERLRLAVRDNVLAAAQQKATREDGTLDVQALRNALFRPLNPKSGPSVMDILEEGRYSVVTPQFREKLNLLLSHLDNTQAAMAFNRSFRSQPFDENLAEQFLIRFAGANLGSSVPGVAPSLQTASFGAQTMRKVFDHLPTGKALDLLTLALEPTPEGKELFRRLLERGIRDKPLTAQGILSPATSALERAVVRLVGAPIVYLPGAQSAVEQFTTTAPEDQPLVRQPAPRPAAPPPPPPPPPAPPMAAPRPAAPAPRPAAPAPRPAAPQQQGSVTNPEDRARFASLFPSDFISPLI
jgi:hypothetical protein